LYSSRRRITSRDHVLKAALALDALDELGDVRR
jgi:hypothetical protein